MAEAMRAPRRSSTFCWLAAILGAGLILGAAYLFLADYTASEGGRCGSLASMSETVHYSPPNDRGCASTKDTRVVLFLATGLAGLVLVAGGVGGALRRALRQPRRGQHHDSPVSDSAGPSMQRLALPNAGREAASGLPWEHRRMLWRIFSGLVGICSYVTLALGVSSSHAAAPWTIVGYIGAVFTAVAMGSYTAALRSGHPSHPCASQRPETTTHNVVRAGRSGQVEDVDDRLS